MRKNLVAFMVGIIFALGLGISGMTQPHIVRGFLDVFGTWDWRLMGVMIGAIGVHAITYPMIRRRNTPILEAQFHVPEQNTIDARLISGAILFGLGWGWIGICPGPGIVSLASGRSAMIYFVVSMLIGMKFYQTFEKRIRGLYE